MALAEHYHALTLLHVVLVIASGMLFAGRALGVMFGARAPLSMPARRTSQVIDTALLGSALLLLAALGLNPLHAPWLMAKLALLVAYVVAGYVALRGSTHARRLGAFALAAGCYAGMAVIARTKDPSALVGWLGR